MWKLRKELDEYDDEIKIYEYEQSLIHNKIEDVRIKKQIIANKIYKLRCELKVKILTAKYKFSCLKEFNNINISYHYITLTKSNIIYNMYNNTINIIVYTGQNMNYEYSLLYNADSIVLDDTCFKKYNNPDHYTDYIELFKFIFKNFHAIKNYISSVISRLDNLFNNYILAIEFLLCTLSRPPLLFPKDISKLIANKILFFPRRAPRDLVP